MRCLVIGAGGQIGLPLWNEARRRGWFVEGTWYRRRLEHCPAMDLCDGEAVREIIRDCEPDAVLVAGGMSQWDYAESHEAECREVGLGGLKNVLAAAMEIDATVVHFSSEQVFGECQHPMGEEETVSPKTVYGKVQAACEDLLQKATKNHLIIRTGSVYGPHPLSRNIANHAVRRLRDGHMLTAAKDRYLQPTYAEDLARVTIELVERGICGTIHITGGERLTEASFFRQIAFLNRFDSDMIAPVPAEALCEDAPRPLSSWLDRARLRSLLGSQCIRPISEGLRAMRERPAELPLARAA